MNAHATSSGIIDLKKDSGFYVDAELSSSRYSLSNSSNSSNITSGLGTSDTVKMVISIANEETIVATNCLSFSYYDCGRYNCFRYSSSGPIDYPTFTVAGATQIQSYIHLDYSYWNKETSSSFYMATSCGTGDPSSSIGNGKHGVLGLGAGTSSKDDFTSSAIFSILIDSDLNGGKLLFMKDTSYAQSSSPLYTFYGNSTWQIPNFSGSILIDGTAIYWKSGNIMFDINSDAIGVPQDMYSLLRTYFAYTPNVWCNSDLYRPTCYTTQKLEDLPDITISFNNYQLAIPSKIYATYSSTSGSHTTYFYFNFKATGPSMTGKNYVTSTFKDSIILDAHFMSYYYTVFDATDNTHTISLYLSSNIPGDDTYTKWVAIGAVGVILLVALCCCCAKKKKAVVVNNATTAPINTTTDAYNAAQASNVYSQQGVNNPAYSYGTANYNYPGYNNYPGQPQAYQLYPAQNQGRMYVPPAQTGQFQERAKQ